MAPVLVPAELERAQVLELVQDPGLVLQSAGCWGLGLLVLGSARAVDTAGDSEKDPDLAPELGGQVATAGARSAEHPGCPDWVG